MTGAEIMLAKSIADATGLTSWIASKFGDSAPVAKAVIDTAVMVTGAKNPQDVVDILSRDSVKAAEVAQAVRDDEMTLINLAYQDLKDARDMYKNTGHDQADKIAHAVIRYNLPMVALLVLSLIHI